MDIILSDDYRDILGLLLWMVDPPTFGAIARLNKRCSLLCKQMTEQKQRQWLVAEPSNDPSGVYQNQKFSHNGRFHGLHREWHAKGMFYWEHTYSNGIKHGKAERRNALTGDVVERAYYVNGHLEGEYIIYWPNRQPLARYLYKNNMLNGEQGTWYDNGQRSSRYIAHDNSVMKAEFWAIDGSRLE